MYNLAYWLQDFNKLACLLDSLTLPLAHKQLQWGTIVEQYKLALDQWAGVNLDTIKKDGTGYIAPHALPSLLYQLQQINNPPIKTQITNHHITYYMMQMCEANSQISVDKILLLFSKTTGTVIPAPHKRVMQVPIGKTAWDSYMQDLKPKKRIMIHNDKGIMQFTFHLRIFFVVLILM